LYDLEGLLVMVATMAVGEGSGSGRYPAERYGSWKRSAGPGSALPVEAGGSGDWWPRRWTRDAGVSSWVGTGSRTSVGSPTVASAAVAGWRWAGASVRHCLKAGTRVLPSG